MRTLSIEVQLFCVMNFGACHDTIEKHVANCHNRLYILVSLVVETFM